MSRSYRPANGSEGEIFLETFCYQCKHFEEGESNDGCGIWAASMLHQIEDPEYPVEWTYDEKDKPVCTDFERKSE